jgi:hypothetical protein
MYEEGSGSDRETLDPEPLQAAVPLLYLQTNTVRLERFGSEEMSVVTRSVTCAAVAAAGIEIAALPRIR